jgi:nucleoside-diphosphate-sugar epimerase
MRIGITGASGFIGSHLLRALKQQRNITVSTFQRNSKNSFDASRLKAFVKNKDLIYHLAGVNRGTDEEILRDNIIGTFNLAQSIKANASSARIVFASSVQVYKPDAGRVGEDGAAEPASLYGLSKKAAEDIIRLSGLDYVILRISNVYGPGCRPNYNSVIATFCDRAVRSQPLVINGDGRQGRDFIYIDDLVRALALAGLQPVKERVFNISSNRLATLRQVVGGIKREYPALEATYRARADGPEGNPYNNARFRKLYHWKPKLSLAEGIRHTLRWFEERNSS